MDYESDAVTKGDIDEIIDRILSECDVLNIFVHEGLSSTGPNAFYKQILYHTVLNIKANTKTLQCIINNSNNQLLDYIEIIDEDNDDEMEENELLELLDKGALN